jgi:hypothetical protein
MTWVLTLLSQALVLVALAAILFVLTILAGTNELSVSLWIGFIMLATSAMAQISDKFDDRFILVAPGYGTAIGALGGFGALGWEILSRFGLVPGPLSP